jgi:hypothetical protein
MFIDGTQKLSLIARSGVYDLAEPAQHLYQSCDSRSRPRFGNAFKDVAVLHLCCFPSSTPGQVQDRRIGEIFSKSLGSRMQWRKTRRIEV